MSDDNGDSVRNNANTARPAPPRVPASVTLMEHVRANKVDVVMWTTRLLTILFAVLYIFPIIGSQRSSFNKVLLANAATSALRLHQRLPAFTLSREFLGRIFIEDSCHYLLYSLIFFSVSPTLLVLVPIVLFAALHSCSYSLKMLDLVGQNSWWGARFLISLVEYQTTAILKAAAFAEIFLMPVAVIMTFTGKSGIMTPIFYYHFLVMRYNSRRNRYTRNAFAELRMITESLAHRSPAFVARILLSIIAFVNRLGSARNPEAQAQ